MVLPKSSSLFRASLTITVFFAVNKLVALLRQGIIVYQYGFSAQIDAFNIANNVPDLLASLISGGAFAVAIIPVLSEYLHKKGREETWLLFSRVANLVFLATAILSLLVWVFADQLVRAEFGIAPGFSAEQQILVVNLMRINLLGTLIFAVSGLVMAALQANKHFLLPALAPILYNLGQIFGALILTPVFGMGIYGLVYGVVLGAFLHLGIQIPGMIYYRYRWSIAFNLTDEGVRKVLRLMGPRILTVLSIQVIFLMRDNLASRLAQGSVTALTYGYFIMQVPETLIGTAIATAILPTISQLAHYNDQAPFEATVNRAIRVILALTVILTTVAIVSLRPLIQLLFSFSSSEVNLLTWTSIAYLIGLTSQCLLEVATRVFYAKQNAIVPLTITGIRMVFFIFLASQLVKILGAVGLALADTLTISLEVGLLLLVLYRRSANILALHGTLPRTLAATGMVVVATMFLRVLLPSLQPGLSIIILTLVSLCSFFLIKKELHTLLRL